jgi:hypothetical protein
MRWGRGLVVVGLAGAPPGCAVRCAGVCPGRGVARWCPGLGGVGASSSPRPLWVCAKTERTQELEPREHFEVIWRVSPGQDDPGSDQGGHGASPSVSDAG